VIDGVLGIDVSKNTLDASMSSCNKVRARSFANSPDGWRHLLDWLITQRVRRVHACLESTGRYSLGIAGALNEAGHVVSIVNPAQIRDSVLRRKRDLLLSISGVGETLAGVVLAELPGPDVLHSSAEVVAYVGLNPRQHQSGTSIDRVTRISKIGNAVLRAALYMPAMSAMRYNPAIVALVARLKSRGRLKPKQIVVAAMRNTISISC
jgi:transposase